MAQVIERFAKQGFEDKRQEKEEGNTDEDGANEKENRVSHGD